MSQQYELVAGHEQPQAEMHIERRKKRRRFWPSSFPTGWRFGILSCALAASISFLVNLVITIVVVARYGVDSDGQLQLYEGNCKIVERSNTAAHIYINLMGTILLGSSSYAMQCLSSATRKDVDKAHGAKKPRWLDVGVLSLSNLLYIDWKRVLLWVILGLSSLPLHLFYNSAVFSTIVTYAYPIVSVNRPYVSNYRLQSPRNESTLFDYYYSQEFVNNLDFPMIIGSDRYLLDQPNLEHLQVDKCIDAYAQTLQTSRGGLVLVLDVPAGPNATDPMLFSITDSWIDVNGCDFDHYSWICSQTRKNRCWNYHDYSYRALEAVPCEKQLSSIKTNETGWMPWFEDYPVKECLSQRMPEACKLRASRDLMIVVLLLNFGKAIAMLLVPFVMRETPLLTVGDAIASFLDRPDPVSKGLCLVTSKEIERWVTNEARLAYAPRVFSGRKPRWWSTAGRVETSFLILLMMAVLLVVSGLFARGISIVANSGLPTSLEAIRSMGFGSANPITVIWWSGRSASGKSALALNSAVANAPQLLLSFIYFGYNNVFTSYFLRAEWQSYMHKRKGLRVSSSPKLAQRDTYFFSLPYRGAIPLMVISGILHWLVSQSIFLVSIETLIFDIRVDGGVAKHYRKAIETDYSHDHPNMLTCGFSLYPLIFVLAIGGLISIALVLVASLRLNGVMPMAGSNTIAIAAACHLQADSGEKEDVSTQPIQWGVTKHADGDNGVGHCSFSSKEVDIPQHLALYA